MAVPAVVLAGGVTKGDLYEACWVQETALVEIAGKPMVRYVVDALAAAQTVGEILVVGFERVAQALADTPARFTPAGETILDNVMRGIDGLSTPAAGAEGQDYVLLSTCDLPLLTAEAVDRFVRASLDTGAQFCYPVIAREVCLEKYPEAQRTWVKVRDGEFTGGNLVLASRKFLKDNRAAILSFFEARKSPLKLALRIGPVFLLKLALRVASIAEVERRAGKMFNCTARAIICPDPEVGMDVDKAADLELARRVLEG